MEDICIIVDVNEILFFAIYSLLLLSSSGVRSKRILMVSAANIELQARVACSYRYQGII